MPTKKDGGLNEAKKKYEKDGDAQFHHAHYPRQPFRYLMFDVY